MTDHYAGNRTQKYGIRRKIIGKFIAAFQKIPGQDADSDDGCDVAAASDVLENTRYWRSGYQYKTTYDVTGH